MGQRRLNQLEGILPGSTVDKLGQIGLEFRDDLKFVNQRVPIPAVMGKPPNALSLLLFGEGKPVGRLHRVGLRGESAVRC